MAMFGLGVPELLIILAVVLLLFGGSRLAGLGKSTGRALREFKEETKDMSSGDKSATSTDAASQIQAPQIQGHQAATGGHQSMPGEIVEPTATDLPRTDQPQSTPEPRRDV
ncbi:MAG: twin-arginine translocase TatA/TatE family subunit [Propionibacteriaceae bacterium]